MYICTLYKDTCLFLLCDSRQRARKITQCASFRRDRPRAYARMCMFAAPGSQPPPPLVSSPAPLWSWVAPKEGQSGGCACKRANGRLSRSTDTDQFDLRPPLVSPSRPPLRSWVPSYPGMFWHRPAPSHPPPPAPPPCGPEMGLSSSSSSPSS